jgi:hypothetical protein
MSTKDTNTPTNVNGATKTNSPAPKIETQEKKPELSNYQVSAPVPTSTIQERINRFHELELLKEKRDEVEEALGQLDKFQISPTGSANMKLSDGKGNTFGIAHPIVIGEMVALAKSKLKSELEKIDTSFIL